jgi:hypothetical protein
MHHEFSPLHKAFRSFRNDSRRVCFLSINANLSRFAFGSVSNSFFVKTIPSPSFWGVNSTEFTLKEGFNVRHKKIRGEYLYVVYSAFEVRLVAQTLK